MSDQPNTIPEYGVFSPPEPLPNPGDLSNGAYGNQLRYGILNLNDPTTLKQFNQVLGWLKMFGAPTGEYSFFTPQNAGGLGSTQIIFSGPLGQQSIHDATMLYNMPEVALTQLALAFGFPLKSGSINFPGFEAIEQQDGDPVGPALPKYNTHGWNRPFARYYTASSFFTADKYPINSRFTRLSSDEEFSRTQIIAGFKPGLTPFSMVMNIQPVWERLR